MPNIFDFHHTLGNSIQLLSFVFIMLGDNQPCGVDL